MVDLAAPQGDWKGFTQGITNGDGGRLEVDVEGLSVCIQMCADHARAMAELGRRAQTELRAIGLGIGENDGINCAQDLVRKFDEKAIGGPGIDIKNTAVGLFKAHENYARDMKSMFEAVIKRYNEQDNATADNLNSTGQDL